LVDYIKSNGSIDSGNCVCIHFEMDSFIMKYLEGGYDWSPHYDQSQVQFFIEPDGKARIGCIYIFVKELENHPDEIEVTLTAATSDMSLLFRDSVSISRWFVEFSKELNAIMTYIDLEDEGAKIIYYNGAEVNLMLKSNHHLADLRHTFLDMITAFHTRYEHYRR